MLKRPEVGALYQHFKGQMYKVIGLARHSETLEDLVVYQALYGDFSLWVRPLKMFMEMVEVEGTIKPRFSKKEISQ